MVSNKTGKIYSLPSEEQWEYAARSKGKEQRYSGTSLDGRLKNYAWFEDNADDHPRSVGEKQANDLGVYDMNGNVKEWCFNFFYNYKNKPVKNIIGAQKGESKVFRGGCFSDNHYKIRIFYRVNKKESYGIARGKIYKADFRDDDLGFRVVQLIKKER